jgi:hypothetical protein
MTALEISEMRKSAHARGFEEGRRAGRQEAFEETATMFTLHNRAECDCHAGCRWTDGEAAAAVTALALATPAPVAPQVGVFPPCVHRAWDTHGRCLICGVLLSNPRAGIVAAGEKPTGGLHDAWCDAPKSAGPCNCRLAAPSEKPTCAGHAMAECASCGDGAECWSDGLVWTCVECVPCPACTNPREQPR